MARSKTTDTLYAFVGDLTKSYDDAGVLHVKGLATDATLDIDGQRCDPAWLKSAMPKWMEWGNVREMHGSNAVGTAVDMEQKGAGWIIEAAIVDPLAAKKVESGVYKGFSIGIKGYGLDKSAAALELAPNGIINSGEIIEISIVDRPANPNAKLEVAKMVDGDLVKIDAPSVLEVVTTHGVPCSTCSGFGKVLHEGGTTNEFHECPACHGTGSAEQGTGGIDVRPSEDSGDKADGEVDSPLKSALSPELVKSLKELTKAPTHDPAELKEIRSGFVALINAELAELESGADDEINDVYQLLAALSTFLDWWDDEADEGETDAPFSEGDDMELSLGVVADLIKGATADDATPEAREGLDSLVKALGIDDKISPLVTANEELGKSVQALTAELEQVKAMAAPRGISLRPTQEQKAKSAQRETLLSEAKSARDSASLFSDPHTRSEFMKKAAELETQAEAIKNESEG